jgi:hypothetical protein
MSKKHKQSKKAAKSSKRTELAAKPDDEIDTDTMSASTEVSQAAPTIPEAEVVVESQQPVASVSATPAITQVDVPEVPVESQQANPVTTEVVGSGTTPKATRSDAAKANIKEGLRLHQIAGRPTKAQLVLVFGKAGYLLTWPKRTEKFGITHPWSRCGKRLGTGSFAPHKWCDSRKVIFQISSRFAERIHQDR